MPQYTRRAGLGGSTVTLSACRPLPCPPVLHVPLRDHTLTCADGCKAGRASARGGGGGAVAASHQGIQLMRCTFLLLPFAGGARSLLLMPGGETGCEKEQGGATRATGWDRKMDGPHPLCTAARRVSSIQAGKGYRYMLLRASPRAGLGSAPWRRQSTRGGRWRQSRRGRRRHSSSTRQ